MHNTLSERLKEAMKGPPKVTGRDLAKACSISPPSVSDWLSGKSKNMEGSNLLAAAEKLQVRAKWLADGTGPMRDADYYASHKVSENRAVSYLPEQQPDPLELKLIALFHQLDADGKRELLSAVEFFVAGRRPHQDGRASVLAG